MSEQDNNKDGVAINFVVAAAVAPLTSERDNDEDGTAVAYKIIYY
jgi:hypothetical protein